MNLGLKDKVVLCMASASGLGKGIAMEMAREGARVMLSTSKPFEKQLLEAQKEIEQETGNKPYIYLCDMQSNSDIQTLVNYTMQHLGDIWALVNMCPGPRPGKFESFQDQDWEQAFQMCLLSYIRTIRACLPSMKKKGGRILNSTSSSIKDCLDNLILSNTMRMGVVGLSKTLSMELGKYNILVNVIGPGRVSTQRIIDLNKYRAQQQNISVSDYEKKDLEKFPLGRYGTVEEYGKTATFLCSEANTYISGQAILVDGAMTKSY